MNNNFNGPGHIEPKIETKKRIDMNDKFLFGQFLKDRKVEKKHTQLALEIGVTDSTITAWEEGVSFPGKKNKDGIQIEEILPKIARAYDVDLEELTKFYKISRDVREEEKNVMQSLRRKGNQGLKSLEGDGVYGIGGSVGKQTKAGTGFTLKR